MAFLNLTEIAGAGADVEPEYRNTPHAAFALLRERREKRPAPRGVLREMRGAGHAVNLAETETAQPCHGLRSTTLPNNCARAKQTETSGICPGEASTIFLAGTSPRHNANIRVAPAEPVFSRAVGQKRLAAMP